jgi:hypothetical protein
MLIYLSVYVYIHENHNIAEGVKLFRKLVLYPTISNVTNLPCEGNVGIANYKHVSALESE